MMLRRLKEVVNKDDMALYVVIVASVLAMFLALVMS